MPRLSSQLKDWLQVNGFTKEDLNKISQHQDNHPAARHTPLTYALCEQRYDFVDTLVANGADLNQANVKNYPVTPLIWVAVWSGDNLDAARCLLKHASINVDQTDSRFGWTPLMWAAHSGSKKVLGQLLAVDGIQDELCTPDTKKTAFQIALKKKHADIALALKEHWLLKNGFIVKDLNKLSTKLEPHRAAHHIPLTYALAYKRYDLFTEFTKSYGINLNLENNKNYPVTPLMWVALWGKDVDTAFDCVMQAPHVNVNYQDKKFGYTALMCAVWYGNEPAVKRLLSLPNVNHSLKSKRGKTALDIAKARGYTKISEILASRLNTEILIRYIQTGKLKEALDLISNQDFAIDHQQPATGETALIACAKQYKSAPMACEFILRYLCAKDASNILKDTKGKTALDYAPQCRQLKTIEQYRLGQKALADAEVAYDSRLTALSKEVLVSPPKGTDLSAAKLLGYLQNMGAASLKLSDINAMISQESEFAKACFWAAASFRQLDLGISQGPDVARDKSLNTHTWLFAKSFAVLAKAGVTSAKQDLIDMANLGQTVLMTLRVSDKIKDKKGKQGSICETVAPEIAQLAKLSNCEALENLGVLMKGAYVSAKLGLEMASICTLVHQHPYIATQLALLNLALQIIERRADSAFTGTVLHRTLKRLLYKAGNLTASHLPEIFAGREALSALYHTFQQAYQFPERYRELKLSKLGRAQVGLAEMLADFFTESDVESEEEMAIDEKIKDKAFNEDDLHQIGLLVQGGMSGVEIAKQLNQGRIPSKIYQQDESSCKKSTLDINEPFLSASKNNQLPLIRKLLKKHPVNPNELDPYTKFKVSELVFLQGDFADVIRLMQDSDLPQPIAKDTAPAFKSNVSSVTFDTIELPSMMFNPSLPMLEFNSKLSKNGKYLVLTAIQIDPNGKKQTHEQQIDLTKLPAQLNIPGLGTHKIYVTKDKNIHIHQLPANYNYKFEVPNDIAILEQITIQGGLQIKKAKNVKLDANISATGELKIEATEQVKIKPKVVIAAQKNVLIAAKGLENSQSQIRGRNVAFVGTDEASTVNNGQGLITASHDVLIQAGSLDNTRGSIYASEKQNIDGVDSDTFFEGGAIDIYAHKNVNNTRGVILAKDAVQLKVKKQLTTTRGTINSKVDDVVIASNKPIEVGSNSVISSEKGVVAISASSISQSDNGLLAAKQQLHLKADKGGIACSSKLKSQAVTLQAKQTIVVKDIEAKQDIVLCTEDTLQHEHLETSQGCVLLESQQGTHTINHQIDAPKGWVSVRAAQLDVNQPVKAKQGVRFSTTSKAQTYTLRLQESIEATDGDVELSGHGISQAKRKKVKAKKFIRAEAAHLNLSGNLEAHDAFIKATNSAKYDIKKISTQNWLALSMPDFSDLQFSDKFEGSLYLEVLNKNTDTIQIPKGLEATGSLVLLAPHKPLAVGHAQIFSEVKAGKDLILCLANADIEYGGLKAGRHLLTKCGDKIKVGKRLTEESPTSTSEPALLYSGGSMMLAANKDVELFAPEVLCYGNFGAAGEAFDHISGKISVYGHSAFFIDKRLEHRLLWQQMANRKENVKNKGIDHERWRHLEYGIQALTAPAWMYVAGQLTTSIQAKITASDVFVQNHNPKSFLPAMETIHHQERWQYYNLAGHKKYDKSWVNKLWLAELYKQTYLAKYSINGDIKASVPKYTAVEGAILARDVYLDHKSRLQVGIALNRNEHLEHVPFDPVVSLKSLPKPHAHLMQETPKSTQGTVFQTKDSKPRLSDSLPVIYVTETGVKKIAADKLPFRRLFPSELESLLNLQALVKVIGHAGVGKHELSVEQIEYTLRQNSLQFLADDKRLRDTTPQADKLTPEASQLDIRVRYNLEDKPEVTTTEPLLIEGIITQIWGMKELFYAAMQPELSTELREQALKHGALISDSSLYRQWLVQLPSEQREFLFAFARVLKETLREQDMAVYIRAISQLIKVRLPKTGARNKSALVRGDDLQLKQFLQSQPRLAYFLNQNLNRLTAYSDLFKVYSADKGLLLGQKSLCKGKQEYTDEMGQVFKTNVPDGGFKQSLFDVTLAPIKAALKTEASLQKLSTGDEFKVWYLLQLKNKTVKAVLKPLITDKFKAAVRQGDLSNQLFTGQLRSKAFILHQKQKNLISPALLNDPAAVQQQAVDLAKLTGAKVPKVGKKLTHEAAIALAEKNQKAFAEHLEQQINQVYDAFVAQVESRDYKGCGADLLCLSALTKTAFEVHPIRYRDGSGQLLPAGEPYICAQLATGEKAKAKSTLLFTGRGYGLAQKQDKASTLKPQAIQTFEDKQLMMKPFEGVTESMLVYRKEMYCHQDGSQENILVPYVILPKTLDVPAFRSGCGGIFGRNIEIFGEGKYAMLCLTGALVAEQMVRLKERNMEIIKTRFTEKHKVATVSSSSAFDVRFGCGSRRKRSVSYRIMETHTSNPYSGSITAGSKAVIEVDEDLSIKGGSIHGQQGTELIVGRNLNLDPNVDSSLESFTSAGESLMRSQSVITMLERFDIKKVDIGAEDGKLIIRVGGNLDSVATRFVAQQIQLTVQSDARFMAKLVEEASGQKINGKGFCNLGWEQSYSQHGEVNHFLATNGNLQIEVEGGIYDVGSVMMGDDLHEKAGKGITQDTCNLTTRIESKRSGISGFSHFDTKQTESHESNCLRPHMVAKRHALVEATQGSIHSTGAMYESGQDFLFKAHDGDVALVTKTQKHEVKKTTNSVGISFTGLSVIQSLAKGKFDKALANAAREVSPLAGALMDLGESRSKEDFAGRGLMAFYQGYLANEAGAFANPMDYLQQQLKFSVSIRFGKEQTEQYWTDVLQPLIQAGGAFMIQARNVSLEALEGTCKQLKIHAKQDAKLRSGQTQASTKMKNFGVSVGYGTGGYEVGVDASGSKQSSNTHRHGHLNVAADAEIVTGNDLEIKGMSIKAARVFLEAVRDIYIGSVQDTRQSRSWSVSASTSGGVSASSSSSNSAVTTEPTVVYGAESLCVQSGRKTINEGAILQVANKATAIKRKDGGAAFYEYRMPEDGDCALHCLNIARPQAALQLLDNKGKPEIRNLVAPEIEAAVLSPNLELLPAVLHTQEAKDLIKTLIQAQTELDALVKKLNKGKGPSLDANGLLQQQLSQANRIKLAENLARLTQAKQAIQTFSKREDIFEAYVSFQVGAPADAIGNGCLNAIAKLNNKNVAIWQKDVDGKLQLVHQCQFNKRWETVNLYHTQAEGTHELNHFNLLHTQPGVLRSKVFIYKDVFDTEKSRSMGMSVSGLGNKKGGKGSDAKGSAKKSSSSFDPMLLGTYSSDHKDSSRRASLLGAVTVVEQANNGAAKADQSDVNRDSAKTHEVIRQSKRRLFIPIHPRICSEIGSKLFEDKKPANAPASSSLPKQEEKPKQKSKKSLDDKASKKTDAGTEKQSTFDDFMDQIIWSDMIQEMQAENIETEKTSKQQSENHKASFGDKALGMLGVVLYAGARLISGDAHASEFDEMTQMDKEFLESAMKGAKKALDKDVTGLTNRRSQSNPYDLPEIPDLSVFEQDTSPRDLGFWNNFNEGLYAFYAGFGESKDSMCDAVKYDFNQIFSDGGEGVGNTKAWGKMKAFGNWYCDTQKKLLDYIPNEVKKAYDAKDLRATTTFSTLDNVVCFVGHESKLVLDGDGKSTKVYQLGSGMVDQFSAWNENTPVVEKYRQIGYFLGKESPSTLVGAGAGTAVVKYGPRVYSQGVIGLQWAKDGLQKSGSFLPYFGSSNSIYGNWASVGAAKTRPIFTRQYGLKLTEAGKLQAKQLINDGVPEKAAIKFLRGEKLTPRDYNAFSIGSDPKSHKLWEYTLSSVVSSRRSNVVKELMEDMQRGVLPHKQEDFNKRLSIAFGYVSNKYRDAAKQQGLYVGDALHHWNYKKSDFSSHVFNPDNLFPMSDEMHKMIHRMTSIRHPTKSSILSEHSLDFPSYIRLAPQF